MLSEDEQCAALIPACRFGLPRNVRCAGESAASWE
jgi:hypothetical protein